MGLKEDLLRGIYSYGFEKPSAIQQRAIKPLIMMRDTIAQAQSGTGKTATFTIGALPPAYRHQPTVMQPRAAASQLPSHLRLCRIAASAASSPTDAAPREGTRPAPSIHTETLAKLPLGILVGGPGRPKRLLPSCPGLLQNIDLSNRDCQALILAPTRTPPPCPPP